MSQKRFLFVYNDNYGKIRHQAKADVTSLADQLTTVELLHLEQDELLSISYPNQKPVWETLHRSGEFLTTVTMRTIMHRIGFPFVSIGASDVLECSREAMGIDADALFMIGISTTFIFDVYTLETLISRLKILFPKVPILIGGAGFTLNPMWFDHCSADFGLVGDAEEALKSLLDAFCTSQPFESVPSLY